MFLYCPLYNIPVAPLGLRCAGVSVYLYTCRPSGAFRGWCAVRTLQIVLFKQALNSTLYKSTTYGLYGKPNKTKPVGGDQATEQGAR